MLKSVFCILGAVVLVIINTLILFLKPEFNFAKNDNKNYCVYYLKWIRVVVFMATLMFALLSINFALNHKIGLAIFLLFLEFILVIIYTLCKYKGVIVNQDEIKVLRLFRKELNTLFDAISKVTFITNAKLVVKLKKGDTFDISFNSENFHKFYMDLIEHNVKFKTGRIPRDENHVYLTKYNITIHFPAKMFREYYECSTYLRNSQYLFSARNLESQEYLEGYIKESNKENDEFIEVIKSDLNINGYSDEKVLKENIDGYDFTIVQAVNVMETTKGRLAYFYHDRDNYLVLYADYLVKNEEAFKEKMRNAIKRSVYEDGKSRIVRV